MVETREEASKGSKDSNEVPGIERFGWWWDQHVPDRHSWSLCYVPDPVQCKAQVWQPHPCQQCHGTDRHGQKMIQESALGAVEIHGEVALQWEVEAGKAFWRKQNELALF